MANNKDDDMMDRIRQIGDLAEQVSNGVKILTGDDKSSTKSSGILGKIGDLFGSSKRNTSRSKKKIKNAGENKTGLGDLDDLLEKADSLGEAKEALEKIQDLLKIKK